jgi:proline racemase
VSSTVRDGRVESVSFVSTPSFLLADGVQVTRPGGVASASGHLPMCGHDTIGLVTVLLEAGLVADRRRRLGRQLLRHVAPRIALAADIRDAVNATVDVVHPVLAEVQGCTHVMFTGEPRDPRATSRCSVIIRPGARTGLLAAPARPRDRRCWWRRVGSAWASGSHGGTRAPARPRSRELHPRERRRRR